MIGLYDRYVVPALISLVISRAFRRTMAARTQRSLCGSIRVDLSLDKLISGQGQRDRPKSGVSSGASGAVARIAIT